MRQVLIVGGGASGILVATQLARKSSTPTAVTIAEPKATLGAGIAYGTFDDEHLLNVPAGRMSAIPEEPNHFQLWANCEAGDFISRKRFGRYLLQTFLAEQGRNPLISFAHERSEVQAIERSGDQFDVTTANGPLGRFDAVVLAVGQGPSHAPEIPKSVEFSPLYVGDPWRDVVPFKPGTLVSIGTGLTFVDLALTHLRRNATNEVVGISRTGTLPERHLALRSAPLAVPETAKVSPDALRRYIESNDDWRAAQDGVRHELPKIWFNWSDDEKSAFWNEHLRWWNVHRHRMSPEVGEQLDHFQREGRLRVLSMPSMKVQLLGDQLQIGGGNGETVFADLMVNTTGYRSVETLPLVRGMHANGLLVSGPLEIGISSNFPRYELLSAGGKATPNLFGIGPVLLGERFETTAIPEIREQAEEIATAVVALI